MTLKKASAALLLASLIQGCATYNPTDHYDPNATVEIGTVVNRTIKSYVTEARADNQTSIGPIFGGGTAMAVVTSIAAYTVESGNGDAQIPIYEYQVKTQNDTMVFVTSRFAGHKSGDCVKVFQSSSPRPDYPRMASGSGCSK